MTKIIVSSVLIYQWNQRNVLRLCTHVTILSSLVHIGKDGHLHKPTNASQESFVMMSDTLAKSRTPNYLTYIHLKTTHTYTHTRQPTCQLSCRTSQRWGLKSTLLCVQLINEELKPVGGGLGARGRWCSAPIYPPPPDFTVLPSSHVHPEAHLTAWANRNYERRAENPLRGVLTRFTARRWIWTHPVIWIRTGHNFSIFFYISFTHIIKAYVTACTNAGNSIYFFV